MIIVHVLQLILSLIYNHVSSLLAVPVQKPKSMPMSK